MILLWASFGFILVSAAVVAYAMSRYRQILSGTNYFIKAATVFILLGEEDAWFAAVASAKSASAKDRKRMKDFLTTLQQSFHNQRRAQSDRVARLMAELGSGGPMSSDAAKARESLRLKNEVYLRALKSGDGGVFLRRYPELFGRDATPVVEPQPEAAAAASAPPGPGASGRRAAS